MKISVCMFGLPKNTLFREQIEYYETLLMKKLPITRKILKEVKAGDDSARQEQELRNLEREMLADTGVKIVLDAAGKEYSTEDFADFMKKSIQNGRDVTFYIGNFYGLDERIRSKADGLLSLSKMTFTHECAAMLLYEQLYRVQTILFGGKYHK